MSMLSWLSGDDLRWEVLTLLVQLTLLLGATIGVTWTCRRHPAARHAVCLSGLCAALAAALAGAALKKTGAAWLTLTWPVSGIAPAAAPLPAAESADFVHEWDASPDVASLSGAMREREISSVAARSPERSADHGDSQSADSHADLDLSGAGANLSTNSNPGRGVAQFANGATGVAARAWALATWSSGAAWLAGVLWLVWRRWRTAAQLRHIVRDALPVDSRTVEESLSQWPPSRRRPAILSSRTLPVPIVCGVLRPQIIVPESLLRPESAPLLRDVLLHELSHILRRDPLAAVVQWMATVLYWPHPLIHVVSRQLSAAREDLCDNFVLQHRSPAEYARTLLQLAEGLSERRRPSAALAMLPRWSHLEERVAGLLDPRRATGIRNPRRVNGLILAATLCVGAAVAGIRAGDEPAAQSAATVVEAQNSAVDAAADSSRRMIVGTVVDETGRPVAGATVRYASASLAGTSARTNADGRFELLIPEGVQRYRWILLAGDATGKNLGYAELQDEDLELELRTEIAVAAANRCTVRVRDGAGQPVAGAIVTAIGGDHVVGLGEAVADESGRALLRCPPQVGVRWVIARKDGVGFDYFENYAAALQQQVGPLPDGAQLTLDGARSVTCRVVDTSGQFVSHGMAYAQSFKMPGKLHEVNLSGAVAVPVNDAGEVRFDWLPARFEQGIGINSSHREYQSAGVAVIRPDDNLDEVTVCLRKLSSISGRVSDLEGRPAPGIRVVAMGVGELNNGGTGNGRSAPDGTFRLAVGPEAAYLVGVTDPDFAAAPFSSGLIGEGESIQDVQLTLARGTLIKGRITAGMEGDPVHDASVAMIFEGDRLPGIIGRAVLTRRLLFRARSDTDGRYSIRVPPGRYRWTVFAGQHGQPHDVRVTDNDAGGTIVVDHHFEAAANRPLTGHVVRASDGAPLAQANVWLGRVGDDDYMTRVRAVTDADGKFRIERNGTRHLVYGLSEDNSLAAFTVLDADADRVTLELTPAATAVGQLLDHAGQPLADFEVDGELRAPNVVSQTVRLSTRTDADGRYRIPGVVVGSRFYLLPGRTHYGHNPAAVISASGDVEIETFKVPRTVNADDADRIITSRESLVADIERLPDGAERRNLLRRAFAWSEELLGKEEREPLVHENAVLMLIELNARPADPDNNVPAVPYTAAYKPLLRVLSDPKSTEDARSAGREGLTRILNGADDSVEGGGLTAEARRQIEEALAAATSAAPPGAGQP